MFTKVSVWFLCAAWWMCLIATYLMYGLKPAIMAFLTSGLGALAIVIDNKQCIEEDDD